MDAHPGAARAVGRVVLLSASAMTGPAALSVREALISAFAPGGLECRGNHLFTVYSIRGMCRAALCTFKPWLPSCRLPPGGILQLGEVGSFSPPLLPRRVGGGVFLSLGASYDYFRIFKIFFFKVNQKPISRKASYLVFLLWRIY